MDELKTHFKSDVYQKLVEANIDSLFDILSKSTFELYDLTHLPIELLETIKNKASDLAFKQDIKTADQVPSWERISTGCGNVDSILSGGIPINGISEIYGSSGVGKTQLCLQLALMVQLPKNIGGIQKEAVYICTEDVFPSKRFQQLVQCFKKKYHIEIDFGSQVYIEHCADFEELRRCLCVSLQKLIHEKKIGLLIIDSIAGIFRSENIDICYTSRSQDIVIIASKLHNICNTHKIAIVCVNQVTENLSTGKTEPCLSLAWGNNVTCRFCITKLSGELRNLEVVFAPDLPSHNCNFLITKDGLTDF